MSCLALSFASCRYDRLEAIRDGDVSIEGVDLTCLTLKSGRQVFDRMVGGSEFDIAELSASEFIALHGAGDCRFVALPVFPSRVFRHGYIFINTRSGIRNPKDLEGRRVGLPLYTQTAAIWARGHLQHQFGIDLEKIHWIQGAIDTGGTHGRPHAPPLLKRIEIEQNQSGEALSDLLARGAIDALIGSRKPQSFGRDRNVTRLFPDYRARERELYETTKIFPIMHLIAMRRELYERHPWVATSFFEACVDAKRAALARMRYAGSLAYMLPWLQAEIEEIEEVFGGDAWPYGIEPNRPTLAALTSYMQEQHFIATTPRLEDLFVPLPGLTG